MFSKTYGANLMIVGNQKNYFYFYLFFVFKIENMIFYITNFSSFHLFFKNYFKK